MQKISTAEGLVNIILNHKEYQNKIIFKKQLKVSKIQNCKQKTLTGIQVFLWFQTKKSSKKWMVSLPWTKTLGKWKKIESLKNFKANRKKYW